MSTLPRPRLRTRQMAKAVSSRMFNDFLDTRNQGANFTWEWAKTFAAREAEAQLAMSYARTPKDLAQQQQAVYVLTADLFTQLMDAHEGPLPSPETSRRALP